MLNVRISVWVNDDDAAFCRDIKLPFAPYKDMQMSLVDNSSTIDELTLSDIFWNHEKERFDVLAVLGWNGKNQPEATKQNMLDRGWTQQREEE